MNLTKAAGKIEKFVIKVGEDNEITVYAYPWRLTDKFMKDNGTSGNTPIAKFLPLVVDNWDLEMDVIDEESAATHADDMEESGRAVATNPAPIFKTVKVPIEETAIQENIPLWLQSEIWGAILRFEVPNLMKSNL